MTDTIQANYETLEQLQKQLLELEEQFKTLLGRILVAHQEIKDGKNWEGEAADAYLQQMDNDFLLNFPKRGKELNSAAKAIGQVAEKFRQAEESAKASRANPGATVR